MAAVIIRAAVAALDMAAAIAPTWASIPVNHRNFSNGAPI
jgi:hypothetical protein